ncbi:hypothetical protein KAI52_01765 [Candidatus Parcubacteria bacterium]|nr:hypothetical protein [Candidatus Parcubacteria bacterium]
MITETETKYTIQEIKISGDRLIAVVQQTKEKIAKIIFTECSKVQILYKKVKRPIMTIVEEKEKFWSSETCKDIVNKSVKKIKLELPIGYKILL